MSQRMFTVQKHPFKDDMLCIMFRGTTIKKSVSALSIQARSLEAEAKQMEIEHRKKMIMQHYKLAVTKFIDLCEMFDDMYYDNNVKYELYRELFR